MEGNDEPLVINIGKLAPMAGSGSAYSVTTESSAGEDRDMDQGDDDCESEGDEAARPRAQFKLSYSASSFGDMDDARSASTIDDDFNGDLVNLNELPDQAESTPPSFGTRRRHDLTALLGMSEAERYENRLKLGVQQEDLIRRLEAADNLTPTSADSQPFGGPTFFDPSSAEYLTTENSEFDYVHKDKNMRRSISLKSAKAKSTTPDSPGQRKAVRFADALGLDLTVVRSFTNQSEPPIVPASAIPKVTPLPEPPMLPEPEMRRVRHLNVRFPMPSYSNDFFRRVQERKVSLEYVTADDDKMTLTGCVRVSNFAFEKQVIVRYTVDGWITYEDAVATFVPNSSINECGPSDQFTFVIKLPQDFDFSSRMEFSVRFDSGGQTHWDSNFGSNYQVECYVELVPVTVTSADTTSRYRRASGDDKRPFY